MTKVGINGFGRIGREVFRVAFNNPEVEVVAVNDPGDITALAHLLKYDSIHGTFNHEVSIEGNYIIVDDRKIEVFACLDPAQIPWGEAGAEIVVESTGRFTEAAKAGAHLHDTVKKVIISAPAKGWVGIPFANTRILKEQSSEIVHIKDDRKIVEVDDIIARLEIIIDVIHGKPFRPVSLGRWVFDSLGISPLKLCHNHSPSAGCLSHLFLPSSHFLKSE